jgi:twinkle protein
MRNFNSYHIDVHGRISGQVKTICPNCNETRHHKGDKSLSVNVDTGLCFCHHCNWKVYVPDEAELREKRMREEKWKKRISLPSHFQRPVFDARKTTLSEKTERYLVETRCIPQDVIRELRITEQMEYMPQSGRNENCICFNYFENGELVNTKSRSGQKYFKMVKDAELIPYHLDGIMGTSECIITEGELDAASFMAIGRKDVISVPAGANGNLTWMERFIDTHFEDKHTVFIATDADAPGMKLRDELIRRFGAERCRVVHYGAECKDANEHLVKYGRESLRIALEQAEEVPIEGIFTAQDLHAELRALYENGVGKGAETGWENFDKNCTFELKRLMVVSGQPGDGKSEWVDELVLRLCLRHGWKTGFFSPENIPIVYHLRKLAEKLTAFSFAPNVGMTEDLYERAENFLTDNVCHILPGNDDYSLETILEKARGLVVRKGIRILVIDPLNRIDQHLPPNQTEVQYLSSFLSTLSRFAVQYGCLVILIAHPRKISRDPVTGKRPHVEMQDISGSADFFNKADFGIIVERDDAKGMVTVHIEKVKFKHLGSKGKAYFVYNRANGRYWPCEEGPTPIYGNDAPGPVNTVFDTESWV